jgi:hypothetical protein
LVLALYLLAAKLIRLSLREATGYTAHITASLPLQESATMTRQQVKLLRFAELYGAGDIKIGLITGEYPNDYFAKLELIKRIDE